MHATAQVRFPDNPGLPFCGFHARHFASLLSGQRLAAFSLPSTRAALRRLGIRVIMQYLAPFISFAAS
jgi:hypothetical protein